MLVIFVGMFSGISSAQAHVLQSNGTIGAVMHVTPEDDPIVGELTDFYFEFKDTTGKFNPEQCDCVISVKKSGEEIYSQPLFSENTNPSLQNASISYRFPEKNVYSVSIIGEPLKAGTFQPFTLTYDLRVERESILPNADSSNGTPGIFQLHILHILIGIALIGLILFLLMRSKKKNHERT